MVTILKDGKVIVADTAHVQDDALWLGGGDYVRVTGEAPGSDERDINVSARWRQLQRPVLRDEGGEVWVLGASARERADALQSLVAPDFTLPDLEGTPHSLSDYRGTKVFLASWSSW